MEGLSGHFVLRIAAKSSLGPLLAPFLDSLRRGILGNLYAAGRIPTYLTVMGLTLRTIFPLLGSMGDINVGIVALLANIVVLVAVSLVTRTSTVVDEAGRQASTNV